MSVRWIGVAKADKQLDLHESQLYTWRKQAKQAKHAKSVSEREASLAAENARLKRQLAQQAEELSLLPREVVFGEIQPSAPPHSYELNRNHHDRTRQTQHADYCQPTR